jgi:hypothetical protein
MHDQAASRISGRTRAAVSAMGVRAVRITVLKSAGNSTRDECHDLNAEKIQRVKCFIFTRYGICCVLAIFERRRGRLGSKISGVVNWRKWRLSPPCPLYPGSRPLSHGLAPGLVCGFQRFTSQKNVSRPHEVD